MDAPSLGLPARIVGLVTRDAANTFFVSQKAAEQNEVTASSFTDAETASSYTRPELTQQERATAKKIEGALNQKVMRIDLLSDISLKSTNPLGEVIPNIDFVMKGGRQIDDGTVLGGEVYSFDQNISTDTGGGFSVENVNPGQFNIALPLSPLIGYTFWKVNSGNNIDANKFNLSPGTDFVADVVFVNT
jgi:hypothetical protein